MFDGPVLFEINDLYFKGAYLVSMLATITIGYLATRNFLVVYAAGTVVTAAFVYLSWLPPIAVVFWVILVTIMLALAKGRTTIP